MQKDYFTHIVIGLGVIVLAAALGITASILLKPKPTAPQIAITPIPALVPTILPTPIPADNLSSTNPFDADSSYQNPFGGAQNYQNPF